MIFDPGWLGRGRGRAVSLSFDYSTLKTITKRLFSKKTIIRRLHIVSITRPSKRLQNACFSKKRLLFLLEAADSGPGQRHPPEPPRQPQRRGSQSMRGTARELAFEAAARPHHREHQTDAAGMVQHRRSQGVDTRH